MLTELRTKLSLEEIDRIIDRLGGDEGAKENLKKGQLVKNWYEENDIIYITVTHNGIINRD